MKWPGLFSSCRRMQAPTRIEWQDQRLRSFAAVTPCTFLAACCNTNSTSTSDMCFTLPAASRNTAIGVSSDTPRRCARALARSALRTKQRSGVLSLRENGSVSPLLRFFWNRQVSHTWSTSSSERAMSGVVLILFLSFRNEKSLSMKAFAELSTFLAYRFLRTSALSCAHSPFLNPPYSPMTSQSMTALRRESGSVSRLARPTM
mmetsp:Transcript_25021/g.51158  ORF Transcript_25021/g.51158 Transcript_25021/m.51158 type:complete len:204 (+) Transcript_25021:253-864(+)